MDETNRNSMKLDIEAVRLSAAEEVVPKESYKVLPDGDKLDGLVKVPLEAVKNSNMVREKTSSIEDGADERMLNIVAPVISNGNGESTVDETELLTSKKGEIIFLPSGDQNGDAKIDIGGIDKNFSAMTKDELMKFANDPFWVRLRTFLFFLFWAIWVAMLVGAILIIIDAPKCSAPEPLPWFKEGQFATVKDSELNADEISKHKFIRGIIYEMNGDETYNLNDPATEERIRNVVTQLGKVNMQVIVDLTPNYATRDSALFKAAMENNTNRSPFIWVNKAAGEELVNNWLRVGGNDSAWEQFTQQDRVLSQFGEGRYDLQFKNPVAVSALKAVLRKLSSWGVKGFRLNNAKHLIIGELNNEIVDTQSSLGHGVYGGYKHVHSTYQDGLGDLLKDLRSTVQNATGGEGFLSVTEDIEMPEKFGAINPGDEFSVDLPQYGRLPEFLAAPGPDAVKVLGRELEITKPYIKNWLQWDLQSTLENIESEDYFMFIVPLPGVPIAPLALYDELEKTQNSTEFIEELQKIRASPTFKYGNFTLYNSANATIAYTRFKPGNPGYFVILNPTDTNVVANYKDLPDMPEEFKVELISHNFEEEGIKLDKKVPSSAVPVAKRSTAIFSYILSK